MSDTKVTRVDNQVLIQPAGDVVAATAPQLRATMRSVVAEGVRDMTLDFSNVQMVDSTGLGLLISAHNSMRKVGGRIAVVNAAGEIVDLFKSMRIHQHFSVAVPASEEQIHD